MKRRARLTPLGSAFLGLAFFASPRAEAQAQDGPVVPARAERLPAFGRSVAATDDATAIVLNPANLAFLPASELRWSSVYLNERALVPWQGHAFTFAFPISLLSVTPALRLDAIDPPARLAARVPALGANYQWLTAALAFGSGTSALGVSYKHAYSDNGLIGGLDAWSVGVSQRMADFIGMSFVVNDIGSPESRAGRALGASYDLALALRPFGSQVVELGLEGKYVSQAGGYWVPRATLGIDIPELGRLRGEFSVTDPSEDATERSWLASAVMSFGFNGARGSAEFGGGTLFGSTLGASARNEAHENLAFDVAFKAYRGASGASPPAHALKVRIEETPDAREHVKLLRELWNIAENEPRVAAVVLEIRATPAESLAHVQELRDAIHHLRNHGKAVLCHLEDSDGAGIYLCAAANRVLINPAGGIRFAGLRARYFYFKSLLEKLGVRAEFVRIGDHKSAPEAFTRDGSSDVARADKIDLLTQFERHFTLSVARGRRIDPTELRRRIAAGPFIAEEARAAGLVDALAFDDEIDAAVAALVGSRIPVIEHQRTRKAPGRFGVTPGIAVIYVEGDMVDGRSRTVPLLGMRTAGSYTLAEAIQAARDSSFVGAIVLRVESGGGSALAADLLWREVERAARKKPVVVSMGATAASGGYYIAAPATRIFANPLSVTGSIGIFMGKAEVSELLRKIGVNVEVYRTAPRADADAFYRPYTDDERAQLQREVRERYDLFLSRVAQGRKISKELVDAAGQGRVWTGEQALARRLVDELGGLRQALAHARRIADLPEYAPIYELPEIETSLLGRLLGIEGIQSSADATAVFPPGLVDAARALAPFAIHPGDKPLARMELTLVAP